MRFNQAAVLHVGTSSSEFTSWSSSERTTKIIWIHGFASLSTVRGAFVDSPEFEGVGNQWRLVIYPGGYSTAAEGMVSIFLRNRSDKAIDIEYGFSAIDGNGKQVAYNRSDGPRNFGPKGSTSYAWGGMNFAKQSNLLSSLVDGALVIKVTMKVASPPPFIPENQSACKVIQGLFNDEESSDIVFEVGGEEQPKDNAMKIAKTAPVTFPAHLIIVASCSSILADMTGSQGQLQFQSRV
jgi:hypothetical protein